MSKEVVLTVDGVDFTVNLPDLDKERAVLETLKERANSFDDKFQVLWEKEDADEVDVFRDIANIQAILDQVESNPNVLLVHLMDIRKKKNGQFWKNSGVDVYVARYMTNYFTDFTNAWSTYVLRLEVIDEETCTLTLRTRTFTV